MKSLIACFCLMTLIVAAPLSACFGPKLYLGVPAGDRAAALAAVVCLYVKEKTGVETVQVPVPDGDGLNGVRGEELDMTLGTSEAADLVTLLEIPGGIFLVSGKRPLQDLQFTTVGPALKKLGVLLGDDFVNRLVAEVAAGSPPVAAARQLMMEQRWI